MAKKKKRKAERKPCAKKAAAADKKQAELVNQNLIYGIGHPLRVRILVMLCDEPSSPRRLSDALGEGLSKVAYHVRVLRKTKLIEASGTRPARGATEHFYRIVNPLVIPEGLWSGLPRPVRRGIWGDVLTDIDEDVTGSVRAETFDSRDDFHISYSPLLVDDKGFKDLAGKTDRYLEEMIEVQVEADKRLAKSDKKPIRATAVILVFESARGPDDDKKVQSRKRG